MAKETGYRVRLAKNSPYRAIAVPGADPSKVLGRGFETLSPYEFKALCDAVKKDASLGLTEAHFEVETIGGSDLPGGFPGKDDLERQGYTTLEQVQNASDEEILALEGIGDATLAKIRAYKPAE